MAPITKDEKCAAEGMKVAGISKIAGAGYSSGTITGDLSGRYSGTTYFEGENLVCTLPESDLERCLVDVLRLSSAPKRDFNKSYRMKNMGRIMGYFALVIPGVVVDKIMVNGRDKAVDKSEQLYKDKIEYCKALPGYQETLQQAELAK